jgi:hypothetical protein
MLCHAFLSPVAHSPLMPIIEFGPAGQPCHQSAIAPSQKNECIAYHVPDKKKKPCQGMTLSG